jgi:hypothetical protein
MILMNNPVGWGADTGQAEMYYVINTTSCSYLQIINITLPWIAAILTGNRQTNRKSRFFDRPMVRIERGCHVI